MLDPRNVKHKYNEELISLSPLVVRNISDRTDDGEVVSEPELQFQITNISGQELTGLEINVNYYINNEFAGTDTDLRLEPFSPNEVDTFSLFVDPPEGVDSAELEISVKRYTPLDKVHNFMAHPIVLIAIFVLLIYSNFK